MATAFVTGATGCLGLHLVRELLAGGWRVIAMHRAGSRLDELAGLAAQRVVGDVTSPSSVLEAMPSGIDVVFHVAGDTSQWALAAAARRRVNVDGTRHLVEAALQRRAQRLVLTSSTAAFGPHRGTIDESAPSTAASLGEWYGLTKWEGEQVVREALGRRLDAVILNPSNFTGPYDRVNWSRLFFLVRDGKLPGAPEVRTSWAHAREVARAHVSAARIGRTGEGYLLAGADAAILEVLALIGELLGRPAPRRTVPFAVLRGLARVQHLASHVTRREPDMTPEGVEMLLTQPLYDCSKAVRELGYRPAPLREIFGDTHRWLVEAGLLEGRPAG